MTKTENARAGAGHTYTGKPMKYMVQRITTAVVLFMIPAINTCVTGGMTAYGRPQEGRHARR